MNARAPGSSRIGDLSRRRLLVVLLLLVVLTGGTVGSLVFFLHEARGEMEQLHRDSLTNAAVAAEHGLLSAGFFEALDDPRPGEAAAARAEAMVLFTRLREETGATDLRVYDRDHHFVLGLTGNTEASLFDQAELLSAGLGAPAFTQPQRAENLYFQTLYYPAMDPLTEEVKGIVAVQGNVEFEATLVPLTRWAVALALGNALAAVALGLLFLWAHRRIESGERARQLGERLAMLGQLAAGVAHELRNPLGIITQSVALLQRRYDPDKTDPYFEYVPAEVARMNGLVKEFLSLAREQPLQPAPLDLAELSERVVAQLAVECRERGVTLVHEATGPAPLVADADRLVQVGMNLVFNALDATPEGGSITSRVAREGREVRWSITDTGAGMDEETRARATEAFFSTRPEGTGLGLAIVQKILWQHGARIDLASRPGAGTTVTLRFSGKGS